MQTPKTGFNMPNFLEPNTVQIRLGKGQLAIQPQLQKGDVLQGFVGQVSQSKGQINIAGESITLEGLSKTFQNKNINIKVLQTEPVIILELKNNTKNDKSVKNNGNIQLNSDKKPVLSPKDTSEIEKNKVITKTFTAHTTTPLPHTLKANKHAHHAIATSKQGPQTTLTVSLANTTASEAKSHINSNKNSSTHSIESNSPKRPIQIGEHFSLRTLEASKNSSQIALTPLRKTPQSTQQTSISSHTQIGTLPAGKIITASVAERLTSGHVVLHWQQQRLEAPAPANVRVGDLLQLEIKPNNQPDNPSLRVVEHITKSKAKAAQLLQQHIGKSSSSQHLFNTLRHISPNISAISSQNPINSSNNQALAQSLSHLQQWSDQYTLNPEKGMDGSRLAKLMQHIGQSYEASLLQHRHDSLQQLQHLKQHDLKALLLQLSHHADTIKNSVEQTQFKQVAERGLAHIESQQALNILSMLQTDPIRFELPMMVQGQWVSVWLSIQQELYDEHEAEKQQQEASHHILFALDLSALGALRIDAHIAEHSVHATFYHENEKARLFVQENTERLHDKLKNIGFEDIFIHTAENKQLSNDKKQQFEQLLNHIPSRDGLLDMQA